MRAAAAAPHSPMPSTDDDNVTQPVPSGRSIVQAALVPLTVIFQSLENILPSSSSASICPVIFPCQLRAGSLSCQLGRHCKIMARPPPVRRPYPPALFCAVLA